MKSFRYLIPILIGLAVLSCSKSVESDDPTPIPEPEPEFPLSDKDETLLDCFSVGWIGEPGEIFEDISKRTGTVSSDISGKRVVFVDFPQLNSNASDLDKAFEDGAIIVVLNPKADELKDFMVDYQWSYVSPLDDDVLLVAYSKIGGYVMHKVPETPDSGVNTVQSYDDDGKKIIEDSVSNDSASEESPVDFTEFGYYCGPFINWLNETMLDAAITPTPQPGSDGYFWHKQINYNVAFKLRKLGGSSDEDYIRGVLPVIVYYVIRPAYLFKGQQGFLDNQCGDFYKMLVSYSYAIKSIDSGESYQYLMSENRVHKHGAIEVWIKGAFMREFSVKTYLDTKGKYSPEFIADNTPVPESFVGSKSYSTTRGWHVDAGIDGGIGPSGSDPSIWGHVNASLKFGHNESTTVSYSLPDLTVANNSEPGTGYGDVPGWKFICNNLPKPTPYTTGGTTPIVAKSTNYFKTHWVWFVSGTPERKCVPTGNLVTEFQPTLGANSNGHVIKRMEHTLALDTRKSTDEMLSLTRMPFGTLNVQNTWADSTITKVTVHPSGSRDKSYSVSSDIIPFAEKEINLPEGNYDIVLTVAGLDKIEHEYELLDAHKPMKVTRRKSKTDLINVSSVRFHRTK